MPWSGRRGRCTEGDGSREFEGEESVPASVHARKGQMGVLIAGWGEALEKQYRSLQSPGWPSYRCCGVRDGNNRRESGETSRDVQSRCVGRGGRGMTVMDSQVETESPPATANGLDRHRAGRSAATDLRRGLVIVSAVTEGVVWESREERKHFGQGSYLPSQHRGMLPRCLRRFTRRGLTAQQSVGKGQRRRPPPFGRATSSNRRRHKGRRRSAMESGWCTNGSIMACSSSHRTLAPATRCPFERCAAVTFPAASACCTLASQSPTQSSPRCPSEPLVCCRWLRMECASILAMQ